MNDEFRILLVDDNPDDRLLIRRALTREFPDLTITEVGDPETLARAIEDGSFDLVITDYGLGFTDGFALLDTLKAQWPECPVILCTGTLSEEIAVEALRKGLDDYVLKDPRRFMRLPAAVRSAIDHARQRAAARAAELRYHELFDGAPVGLIRCLPDGRILAANAAAARLAGFPSVSALLDASVADLCADVDDRARLVGALERGETLQHVEIQGRRRDGELIWVSVNGRPVKDAGGRILHYEWSLADVTERRRLEAQLRQAQKMEAVGQLAGGVAHDFNNLLTVIGGRCYLMLSKLGPEDALRREVELVRGAAERAARLTHQLLAFSRKQALEPRVLDLNEMVTGIEPLLRRLIGEHIEVSVRPGAGLGRVKADPGQVEQVILNLAVNARDAMPQGGQLILETADAVVDEGAARAHDLASGSYVVLSVTDSGHGMDAAIRAQIFEPFFTTKEVGKGTGLGLATVYGIVKQSGGFIEVESEPGRGASFKVCLPRVEEEAAAAEPAKASGTRLRGSETVLLVEDDESLRTLAREILTVQGYAVLEAASPREALRIHQTHERRIDLLLTDVVMPEMNGQQLADHLKIARPDMAVLFMSGYTGAALTQLGGTEFAGHLLQKPFTPDGLSRRVREVLGG
ncbi:MAG TPA: response regulator [Candidatus Deferrimicrobiaceae bacterium]|nr:response regulator [Candidatus Deferrimicrobiaceae bacterium]